MQIIIKDHERGVLTKDGRPIEWLEPGRHRRWDWTGGLGLDVLELDDGGVEHTPELEAIVPREAARVLDVPIGHAAVLEIDGLPQRTLEPGRYLIWQLRRQVSTHVYDLTPAVIEVAQAHLPWLRAAVQTVRVKPWMAVLVYVDGVLERILPAGQHVLAAHGRVVETETVDLRSQERQIVGQELMTKDQATLRLNLVAKYRVVVPERAARAVQDVGDALYTEVQLEARRLVAGLTVDELLTRRVEARQAMTEAVREAAQAWGVEVDVVDIKDVVLPGEMKALLNRVLEAEKQAAAQVILRREETAATRSMANTARMLEQNPMLLRLKELEAMKELADRVGELTVITGAPDWAQRVLQGKPQG